LPPNKSWDSNLLSNSAQSRREVKMLNEEQKRKADEIFTIAKDNLFANGALAQVIISISVFSDEAVIFPLPPKVTVDGAQSEELLRKFGEIAGTELVFFISETWAIKREEIPTIHIPPRECPDRTEAVFMLVFEVGAREFHTKVGYIKRDDKGGPYVDSEEWLGTTSEVHTIEQTMFPSEPNA
jgi:hypothetical protein